MRGKALVVMLCVAFGACGWTAKRGRGTNYDDTKPLTTEAGPRRL